MVFKLFLVRVLVFRRALENFGKVPQLSLRYAATVWGESGEMPCEGCGGSFEVGIVAVHSIMFLIVLDLTGAPLATGA